MKKLIITLLIACLCSITIYAAYEGGARGVLIDLLNANSIGCADELETETFDGQFVFEGRRKVVIVRYIERCKY